MDRLLCQRRKNRTGPSRESIDVPDRPIITGAPSSRPPGGADDGLIRSAFIWDYMEKAGVPDVKGVAFIKEDFSARFRSSSAIRDTRSRRPVSPRSARRAHIWAAMSLWWTTISTSTTSMTCSGRLAQGAIHRTISTCCGAAGAAHSIRSFQKTPKDSVRGRVIDATRPYEWMKDFPRVSGASAS